MLGVEGYSADWHMSAFYIYIYFVRTRKTQKYIPTDPHRPVGWDSSEQL